MSTMVNVYSSAFAYLSYTNQSVNVHTGQTATFVRAGDTVIMHFDAFPSAYQFKRIVKATLYAYWPTMGDGPMLRAYVKIPTSYVDTNDVTYATRPTQFTDDSFASMIAFKSDLPSWTPCTFSAGYAYYPYFFAHGICLSASDGRYDQNPAYDAVLQVGGTDRPYIAFEVDATTTCGFSLANLSPASGAITRGVANTFSWAVSPSDACVPSLAQTSTVFRWREVASGTIHTVSVPDGAQSITIPAGTFTGASIQWQVAVSANSGVTTTSDWIELSTEDAKPSVVALSPKGEVVDNSNTTIFRWTHIITTGTAQTKADLQVSADQQTWTDLATVTGAEQTYTVPANTLGPGTQFWRVRTYNTDGVASEWSDAAEFICVGAPAAPAVSIKSQSPRPVIGWQSSGQLAYQVEINGIYSSGTYYGTDKTWTAPMYLEDGEYIVRVRVQNEYAMWSPWGAATVQVVNTPSSVIALTVSTDTAAHLAWTTMGSYDYFLVYRNGQLVAKTAEANHVDNMVVGAASYQVRGCFTDSGNYGLSDEVSAVISVDCVTVSDLDTGAVLPLPYSDSAHRATSRQTMRSVQLVQLSGRRYPIAERSEAYSDAIDVACLFYRSEDCAALEALVGHMVNVKTPEGWMVSGCLSGLSSRADGGFFTAYTFTVTQTDMEEVIDIDA